MGWGVFAAAAAARVALIAWAAYQDARLEVPFTDIDYLVFTDAARFATSGGSPYDRATYRYTPLLAWALAPSARVAWFGKALFCLGDLAAAGALGAVVAGRGGDAAAVARAQALWLFSPLTAVISARGSAESLTSLLLLVVVRLSDARRPALAAAVLGLAAHWRVFPVFLVLPLAKREVDEALYETATLEDKKRETVATSDLNSTKCPDLFPACRSRPVRNPAHPAHPLPLSRSLVAASRALVRPALAFLVGMLVPCAISHVAYGEDFWRHAVLYHVGRRDPRHSFSPGWLPAALSPDAVSLTERALGVAQAAAVLAAGGVASDDPCLAGALQTIAFVALNRVSTSQYFVWYLTFVTPLLVRAPGRARRGRGSASGGPDAAGARVLVAAGVAWVATQALWLFLAHALEFRGLPMHASLEAASVLFSAAQLFLGAALWKRYGARDASTGKQAVGTKGQR